MLGGNPERHSLASVPYRTKNVPRLDERLAQYMGASLGCRGLRGLLGAQCEAQNFYARHPLLMRCSAAIPIEVKGLRQTFDTRYR